MAKTKQSYYPSKKLISAVVLGGLVFSLGMVLPQIQKQQQLSSYASSSGSSNSSGFGPAGQMDTGMRSDVEVNAGFGSAGSKGMTQSNKCQQLAAGAKCQSVSTACAGGYVDNYCSGNSSIKCCLPTSSSCQKKGGKCVTVNGSQASGKKGTYYSGLCSGPSTIKCFVPKK